LINGRRDSWRAERVFGTRDEKNKKEEFPGIMENTMPENSFPQICVVSVNKCVGNADMLQEYGRSVAIGDMACVRRVRALARA
jgi:hypothetical protein